MKLLKQSRLEETGKCIETDAGMLTRTWPPRTRTWHPRTRTRTWNMSL